MRNNKRICVLIGGIIFCLMMMSLKVVAESSTQKRHLMLSDLSDSKVLLLDAETPVLWLPFHVEKDQLLEHAELYLQWDVIDPSIESIPPITVSINGVSVTKLLAKGGQKSRHEYTLVLDTRFLVADNMMRIAFADMDAKRCRSDQALPAMHLTQSSMLTLMQKPLKISPSFEHLPFPFIHDDPYRRAEAHIILAADASTQQLKSAGLLASWLGVQGGSRGVDISLDQALSQDRHSIVLIEGDSSIEGIDLPDYASGYVAISPHPYFPGRKLLVIAARNAELLHRTVTAVVSGQLQAHQQRQWLQDLELPEPLPAYTAPRWLASDRPVPLLSTVPMAQLSASPSYLNIQYQLPPDLFPWPYAKAKVDIVFHPESEQRFDPFQLTGNLNDDVIAQQDYQFSDFDHSTSFWQRLSRVFGWQSANNENVRENTPETLEVAIGSEHLQSNNHMQWRFHNPKSEQDNCLWSAMNGGARFDTASTIDYSEFHHFKTLPDLSAFYWNAYPFSRWADLSQTAVILNDDYSLADVKLLLNMLAYMGNAIGYPAIHVEVVPLIQLDRFKDRDLLLIGDFRKSPVLQKWPLLGRKDELASVSFMQQLQQFFEKNGRVENVPDINKLKPLLGQDIAVLESFESPLAKQRTVVAINAGSENAQTLLMQAFQQHDVKQSISGSATLLGKHEQRQVELVASYQVGELPWYIYIQWWIQESLWLFLLLFIISMLLLSLVIQVLLQIVAQRRLSLSGQNVNNTAVTG